MLSLFLVLMLAVSGSMLVAQEPVVVCGDLSDEDCAILTESQATMAALNSAAFDFTLDMMLADLPNTPQDVNFTLTGAGGFVVNHDLAARALTEMTAGSFADAMETLFSSFDTDVNLILNLPEDLAGAGQPSRFGLVLRLVEGMAYVNLDKMAEVLGSSAPSGWQGFDLAGFYSDYFQQFEMPATNFTPDADAIAQVSEMVTIERLDDNVSGDQRLAVFQYTYDYGALFESEWFTSIMRTQFATMGLAGQIDEEAFLDAYADMLSTMTLEMTQSIGVDDHYLHTMAFNLDWTIDFDALAEAMDTPSMGLEPFTLNMNLVANLSAFDDYTTIEAPEDATIIPLSGAMLGA